MLKQEEMVKQFNELLTKISDAIDAIYVSKVADVRQQLAFTLLAAIALQVVKDTRNLVEQYGVNTHSYNALAIYEKFLKDSLLNRGIDE